jgi:hypothetical protein
MARPVVNLDEVKLEPVATQVVAFDDAEELTLRLPKGFQLNGKNVESITLSEPNGDTVKAMMKAVGQTVKQTINRPTKDADGNEVDNFITVDAPTAESSIEFAIVYVAGASYPKLTREQAGKLPVSFLKKAAEFSGRFLDK